jgi:hypothetical protein
LVTLALQFEPRLIPKLAARYSYPGEDHVVRVLGQAARDRGWFTMSEFVRLADWKSPRPGPHIRANRPAAVEEATRVALSAEADEIRIGVLLALRGAQWPMASCVLHFGHRDRYPILDVRALESLGFSQPNPRYDFDFWWDYVVACRRLADDHRVDMRTLDRALWQRSKERSLASR